MGQDIVLSQGRGRRTSVSVDYSPPLCEGPRCRQGLVVFRQTKVGKLFGEVSEAVYSYEGVPY